MFLRYNFYTIAWFLLIAGLVLLPGRNMPQLGEAVVSIDKAVHASLFGILTLLMIVGFTKQSTYPRLRNKARQYSLIIALTYAALIEIVQLFSAGRSFEFSDMLANLSGCLVGFLFFLVLYKW